MLSTIRRQNAAVDADLIQSVSVRLTEVFKTRAKHINLTNLGLVSLPDKIEEWVNQPTLLVPSYSPVLGQDPEEQNENSQRRQNTRVHKIRSLDLSENALTFLPAWSMTCYFPLTVSLRQLDLSHNQFSELPDEFSNLKHLQELNLSFNAFEYFPPSVLTLAHLRFLNMSHNSLVFLPSNIAYLHKAEEIDISHNALMNLPIEMRGMKKLKRLVFLPNQLLDSEIEHMRTWLEERRDAGNLLADAESNQQDDDEEEKERRPVVSIQEPESLPQESASESSQSQNEESSAQQKPGGTQRKRKEPRYPTWRIRGPVSIDHGSNETPELPNAAPDEATQAENSTESPPRSPDHQPHTPKIQQPPRINVLMEVLESERKYVSFLNIMYNHFYVPLVLPAEAGLAKEIIPRQIALGLFPSDLQSIIHFNSNLLASLEERYSSVLQATGTASLAEYDKVMIGELFLTFAPFFKMYVSYLSGFEKSLSRLQETRKTLPEFEAFLVTKRLEKACMGLELRDYLIMPVQRVARYPLLLGTLIQCTPESHPDLVFLRKALEKMSENAKYQNAKIAEANNAAKVGEIARKLQMDDLVKPFRKFIREGDCTVTRQKANKNKTTQCHVYLFTDSILVKDETTGIMVKKEILLFNLSGGFISGGGSLSFTVTLEGVILDFQVENEDQKQQWVEAISEAITQESKRNKTIPLDMNKVQSQPQQSPQVSSSRGNKLSLRKALDDVMGGNKKKSEEKDKKKKKKKKKHIESGVDPNDL